MRSEEEVEDMACQTSELIRDEPRKFSGMTYLEGVRAGLDWVLEMDDQESPIE